MLSTASPTPFPIPFANSAGVGYITTVPTASQIGVPDGVASLTDGFPPLNFTPLSAHGVFPWGRDFNGILYRITASIQWQQAGGLPVYNSAFQTAIGGYPNGAVILNSNGNGFWLSTADNNLTNPNTGGAGWINLASTYLAKSVAGSSNVTLTSLESVYPIISATGAITANIALIVPSVPGKWIIGNATTGAYSVTVKTSGGTGVVVPQGASLELYSDGTNVYVAVSDAVTQSPGDNTTKIATTAFVNYAVTNNFSPSSVAGLATNLKIDSIGIGNYNCVITADAVVLENSSGRQMVVKAVSKTINANGTVGAPLSIMSSRAASTWYYRWLWYNVANGLSATLDPSPSAPTAPTGYVSTDYKAILYGASRTDSSGSAYLLQISTRNKKSQYIVLAGSNTPNLPVMASGTAGSPTTPTWVSIAIGAYIPAVIANNILGVAANAVSTIILVAPSTNYGPYSSTSNPSPVSSVVQENRQFDLFTESSNIYYACNGASSVACLGWLDN